MPDFLILLHTDETAPVPPAWKTYLAGLAERGVLRGGGTIEIRELPVTD